MMLPVAPTEVRVFLLIISMIKWIRTSRLSIKNSLSPPSSEDASPYNTAEGERGRERERGGPMSVKMI